MPSVNIEDLLLSYFNPLTAISTIMIFTGFSMLNINKDFSKFAKKTFMIYLIHAGIRDIGLQIVRRIDLDYVIFTIPGFIVAIVMLSYIASLAYNKLWETLNSKYHITDSLCTLLRLHP